MEHIRLTVNGEERQLEIDVRRSLLDVLRDSLDLTGSKKGCDQGQCGACTVLVDGRRVLACLTLAVTKDGASVTTIEGLAKDGKLHPLQQAFIDHDAVEKVGRIVAEIGRGFAVLVGAAGEGLEDGEEDAGVLGHRALLLDFARPHAGQRAIIEPVRGTMAR